MSAINVNVRVENKFSQSATIQLWHQFSSNTPQTFTWTNVAANGGVTPYVVVTGSTSAGHDYWEMKVTLNQGGGVYSHSSAKTCTIESADGGTYQTQVVSSSGWTIPLKSGGCSTSLTPGVGADRTATPEPEHKKPAGSSQGDPVPA